MNTVKTKIKNHGGIRSNAGRKPIDEAQRKKTISLYVSTIDMEKIGGEDTFKDKCYALLKG